MTFREFQKMNATREREAFPQSADWSLNDFATALMGELGEACNLLKKVRREDFDLLTVDVATGLTVKKKILKELADVITYADLMMTRLNASTEFEILDKFDEVSSRRKWSREDYQRSFDRETVRE
jgi:NTP pyrophosphatase (non-canonical NTP hydrolase)